MGNVIQFPRKINQIFIHLGEPELCIMNDEAALVQAESYAEAKRIVETEVIMQKTKKVQIDDDLFLDVYRLVTTLDIDGYTETVDVYLKRVVKPLQDKLDALIKHDLYTTYKTGATEEEKETARQQYLDSVGIHKDWRW